MWCFLPCGLAAFNFTGCLLHTQWYEILAELSIVGFHKPEYLYHWHTSSPYYFLPIPDNFWVFTVLDHFVQKQVGYAVFRFHRDLPHCHFKNWHPILLIITFSSILLKKGTVWEPLSAPVLNCLSNSCSLKSDIRDNPFLSALLSQGAFKTFYTRCCSYAEPVG